MSGGGTLQVLERRVTNLRFATALVLAGLLFNAGLVVLFLALVTGSIAVSLVSLGVMAVVIFGAALFAETFLTSATGARPLLADEYRWAPQMVDDLAHRAGIPPPQVLISDQDSLNAYTTGTGRSAKVAFMRGLLEHLPRDQVRAVAAHEIGHIANRDVALGVWTGAIFFWVLGVREAAIIVAVAIKAFTQGLWNYLSEAGGWYAFFGIFFAACGYAVAYFLWLSALAWAFVSQLMQLGITRQREYLADATAAALTGEPLVLARALAAIAQNPSLDHGGRTVGRFCIVSPAVGAAWRDILSTHPAPERRIEELSNLPAERLQLGDERWRGLGSAALFIPAGAVLGLAGLAILVPLLSSSDDSNTGRVSPAQPAARGVAPGGRAPTATPSSSLATSQPTSAPTRAPTALPTATLVPPTPTATRALPQLAYGQTGAGGIAASGRTERWQFAGQEGDVVTVWVKQAGGASLGPWVMLFDPSGARAAERGYAICDRDARILNYTLRFTGQHTVEVGGGCGSTGGYEVVLSRKLPPQPLAYGESGSGQVAVPDDYGAFTFTGQAGDVVTIRVSQASGASLRPFLVLTDPSGATAASTSHVLCESEAAIGDYALRFAGTYTILVRGGCGSAGGFALTLARSTPIALQPGQTATVTFTARTGNCSGTLRLHQPATTPLFVDYQRLQPGTAAVVGPYPTPVQLVFALEPKDFCGPATYLSTDPGRARMRQLDGKTWELSWEDWNDRNFGDVVFSVRVN